MTVLPVYKNMYELLISHGLRAERHKTAPNSAMDAISLWWVTHQKLDI